MLATVITAVTEEVIYATTAMLQSSQNEALRGFTDSVQIVPSVSTSTPTSTSTSTSTPTPTPTSTSTCFSPGCPKRTALVLELPHPASTAFFRRVESSLARTSDVLVAVSPEVRDELVESAIAPADRCSGALQGRILVCAAARQLPDGRICAISKKDGPCLLDFTKASDGRWKLSGFEGDVSMLRLKS